MNVKFDDEVGDFEFATVTVGNNINSDNKEPMDPINREADIEQIKDSLNKEKPTKHDVRTLKPWDTIKPSARYVHAMLATESSQTYAEAISRAEQWKKAISEQIKSQIKNSTWYKEEMPTDRKAINCR